MTLICFSVYRRKNGFHIILKATNYDWKEFPWKAKFDPMNIGSWNKLLHELMHVLGKFSIIFH